MKLKLRSDALEVRQALRDARSALAGLGLNEDDLARVEIVLAEILNNVVEHACAECPDCRINIDLERGSADLKIEIVDDGKAMPGEKLPEPKRATLHREVEHFPEGGFGWSLIHDLAHDVVYERRGRHNHLSLAIGLQGASGAL